MSRTYHNGREGFLDARNAPFLPLRRKAVKDRGDQGGFIALIDYNEIRRNVMTRPEYVVIVIFSAGLAGMMTENLPIGNPPGSYAVRAVVAGVAAGLTFFLVARAALRSEYYFEYMLRAGWCPACGYELRNTSPKEDGFLLCSQCGGAWEMVEVEESEAKR